MRKLAIVVAAAVALTGFASGTSVASARSATTRSGSVSCSDLVKKYQKANGATNSPNLKDPNAFKKLFAQSAKQLRSLASSGPSELRPSFKRLAAAFDKFANANASDPTFVEQLSSFATTFRSDFEKISRYFAKKCNSAIPNTGGGSASGTSGGSSSDACKLVTTPDVQTAVAHPVADGIGGGGTCVFAAVPAGAEVEFTIIVRRTPTEIDNDRTVVTQAGGVTVAGLGDEAFWVAGDGELFVRKANVAVEFISGLSDPSLAAAAEPRLIALANIALPNL
jgi:hypothetical protein